ncbi:hypothetical protein NJB1507_26890 [Mycobacterium marinum]|uniref:hypothetical protein n=1 Tax=Mycobacterium marinum TaxID=1781 RepID=UPI00235B4748|nr:hypothetical protein NJB1507_26890 [Mycobacterium marinum]
MSFRNVIGWTVAEYDQPKYIELRGRGRGGVRLAVAMTVAAGSPGIGISPDRRYGGGPLGGPIGRLVARILRSEVHTSVRNLAQLR